MKAFESYLQSLQRLNLNRTENVLIADLGEKILKHWRGDECLAACTFSFGKKPLSCREGSNGTPWGLHEIAAKHGGEDPPGMVFIGRVATGERYVDRADAGPDQPTLVVTRILRLRGLEPGLNSGPGIDSFDRFIYIHGTNKPEHFPENISAGCLLLQDEPLIQLYPEIPLHSHVYIHR